MDPLHLMIALGPLAIYVLLLGAVNLRRRPLVMSGARDFSLLAFAVSGFVVVGPMQLFLPDAAAVRFGPYLWLLLLSFYCLCVTLLVLLSRPRLVIYNCSREKLKQVLDDIAKRLDAEAGWTGDILVMPQQDVQFHLEQYLTMRNLSLVAVGERQSFTAWNRLHEELRSGLAGAEMLPNPRGFSFLTVGLMLLGYPLWLMVMERQSIAQRLFEMLRL